MTKRALRVDRGHGHGYRGASTGLVVLACLAMAILVSGCGGSSKHASSPEPTIMKVTGGWYGVPTSVTGEVAAQLTNTANAPVTFTLENYWEMTTNDVSSGSFSPEAARLKNSSAGTISVANPALVMVGPVSPGKTVYVNMIVTVQEPGIDSGYTKVVGREPSTGARAAHIIPW